MIKKNYDMEIQLIINAHEIKKFISKTSSLNPWTAKAVIWWVTSALILVLDKSDCEFLEKKWLHYQYKQLYVIILCFPKVGYNSI